MRKERLSLRSRIKNYFLRKRIIIELIIAAIIFLAIILFLAHFIGIKVFSLQTLDVNVQDAYFVLNGYLVVFFLWTLLYFIVSALRQIAIRFRNIVSNIALIFTSVLLSICNYAVINLWIANHNTTIYPPLSSIPQSIRTEESPFSSTLNFLCGIEIFLVLIIVVAIVFSIKNYRKK